MTYTVETLASKLGITPKAVRAKLRMAKVKRKNGHWGDLPKGAVKRILH